MLIAEYVIITKMLRKCWGNNACILLKKRRTWPTQHSIHYPDKRSRNVSTAFSASFCLWEIRVQKNVRHTSFVNVFSRIPSSPVTRSFARSCSCIRKSIVSQLEVFSHTLFLQISNNLSSENGTQCCRAYLGYKEKRTNVHDLKRALPKKRFEWRSP